MARNSADQNPSNKVGRHSGAGPGGVSRIVPTAAEARRGLQPIELGRGRRWGGGLALGLGALALAGAAVAALVAQRARQPRGLRPRIERLVGLR